MDQWYTWICSQKKSIPKSKKKEDIAKQLEGKNEVEVFKNFLDQNTLNYILNKKKTVCWSKKYF